MLHFIILHRRGGEIGVEKEKASLKMPGCCSMLKLSHKFPSRNLLQWLSRIIAVSGQIITKIWLWGLISDHILSSNKTNCVRDHKKSNYWANFLIIQWLFMILGIIQWLSWLFSDNWWLFMIIQHKSWLFTANQVSPWNAGR